MVGTIIGIAVPLLLIIAVLVLICTSYVKAPPDHAYLISGPRKDLKVINGRAGFKVPFIDRMDRLYLGIIGVDVKTRSAVPTAEYINVFVDANVNVAVGKTPELIRIAAKNFLNQKPDVIAKKAQEVLEGNMREIVGQMKLTEMVSDRKQFAEKVLENAVPDMQKLGLDIISFNVQNFKDENGVIEDLGIDNVEQIKKSAAIAKSNAQRDIAIEQAKNQREANEAQVEAATRIAEQNTALDMKTAELKSQSEVKRAAADMAYDIQRADQKKAFDVAQTNAQIAQAEREVELKNQQIALKEKELDAIVRKKADADLYKATKDAEAELAKRKAEAEARAYEEMKRAEAAKQAAMLEADARKAMADAERYAAESEAAGIAAKYAAEAEGIRAKGVAEAEGIDRKAEAQKKMGEASVLEMYFNMLPEAIAAASKPMESVDKIVLYGEGAQTQLISGVTNTTQQVIDGVKEATGIDVAQVIAGYLGAKAAK